MKRRKPIEITSEMFKQAWKLNDIVNKKEDIDKRRTDLRIKEIYEKFILALDKYQGIEQT